MVVWNEPEGPYEDSTEAGMHAALTYDRIASAGPPARPLEFPTPAVHRGARCSTVAVDHRTGRFYPVKNVLMRLSSDSRPTNRAYLIKKTLSKCVYGVVKSAVVLKRRHIPQDAKRWHPHTGVIRDEDAEWESTEELAVIKVRRMICVVRCASPASRFVFHVFDAMRLNPAMIIYIFLFCN
jgi:hypothetical protein